jgi:hypothetical protein
LKRTKGILLNQFAGEEKDMQEEMVSGELAPLMADRKKLSQSPGVVPGTAKYLEHADPEGN